MLILGIDSSCDDTSASIVEDGTTILSNIVSNQAEIHKKYGGIVPELASRRHTEMIWPVVDEALTVAGVRLEGISAIAVCHGPGLIGSLLVGISFAKAMAYSSGIPIVAVNHLEAHIFSSFLEEPRPKFPFLALIVSGGHTSLYKVAAFGSYEELGRTRDDAVGEAYDKVAKLLGLGYPGGPIIDRLAEKGNAEAINFPRPYLHGSHDFSFSGLKTAVLLYLREHPDVPVEDVAAGFQTAVVDVLVKKTIEAAKANGLSRIVLSGGVSANRHLRHRIMGADRDIEVFLPSPFLCTDNAAMVASAGYYHFLDNHIASLKLNPEAYLPL